MKNHRLLGFSAALVLAGVVASAGPAAAQGTIPDPEIVQNVQALFAAHGVTAKTNLTVTSVHGVVTLNGTARSLAAKDEATGAAKMVTGVKGVNNNLVIDLVPDPTIIIDIKAGFDAHGVTNVAHITITSVGGVVTLTGTANSQAAKDEAGDVAKAARGVKSVVNSIVARQ
jgi:hyperosmotically inducible periplasmic protein